MSIANNSDSRPIKIVSYGVSGVGNNTYAVRLSDGIFRNDLLTVTIMDRLYNVTINDEAIRTMIFSTSGQERFRFIVSSYVKDATGIILSYDTSDRSTFDSVPNLLSFLRGNAPENSVFMLIGMKIDINNREVTTEEGAQFAQKEGLLFAETSSKLNINVQESYINLITEIYNRQKSTNIPKLTYRDANQYKILLTDDANFLYKNVLYPFNFELFKNLSLYFERNQNLLKDKKIINLVDEFEAKTNILPKSIQALIKFSKNDEFYIDVTNVIDLTCLSKKYEIPELQTMINNFISVKYKDIIKTIFESNNFTDLSCYHEDIIANYLTFSILNFEKQFLSFPFHFIYRILQKFAKKDHQNENNSKINEFLIKIIKIHGFQTLHLLFELGIMKTNSDMLSELILQCLTSNRNIDPNIVILISEMNKEIKTLQNIIFSSMSFIRLPPEITQIADHYFEGQAQLKEIILSESLISIGDYSFAGCSLITQITIPASIVSIGSYSFADCKSLAQVNILAQLTSISPHLFENCTSLKKIEIPSSVEVIENESFSGCTALKQVIFKNNSSILKKIEDYAFYNCSSLTTIDIPQNAKDIGTNAFEGCSSLNLTKILKHIKYGQ